MKEREERKSLMWLFPASRRAKTTIPKNDRFEIHRRFQQVKPINSVESSLRKSSVFVSEAKVKSAIQGTNASISSTVAASKTQPSAS